MSSYKIGDNWLIPINLKKENSSFIATGKTVQSRLIYLKGNTEVVLIDSKTLSDSATGADWANGLVVAEYTSGETNALTKFNNIFIEIKVTDGAQVDIWPLREIMVETSSYVSVPVLPYSDLKDDVFLEVPDAPIALIMKRIELVLQDFCKKTDSWIETATVTSTNAESYSIYRNGMTRIQKILTVKVDNVVLDPYYYVLDDCDILFKNDYKPQIDSEIKISLSLMPINGFCADFIINMYRKELVSGCVSSLMMMPNRSWTSFQLAPIFKKEFFHAVSRELSRQASFGTDKSGGISA